LVIVTAPSTSDTEHMIAESELAAMKPTATLMNFARGNLVDQPALVAALKARRIGAAWLDVVDPEPLPPEHELWTLDNAHISMHLSGRAQNMMFIRSADRFLANLDRWHCGELLSHVVDLGAGY
jgi:phosphoglycerate dehydrogenase-like enzyme